MIGPIASARHVRQITISEFKKTFLPQSFGWSLWLEFMAETNQAKLNSETIAKYIKPHSPRINRLTLNIQNSTIKPSI